MPNIEIRGYKEKNAELLKQKIDLCLQKIHLGETGITDMVQSKPESCNGNRTPMPYIRLFSSEIEYVPVILYGFQKSGIHEDVEVIADKIMFFSKEEVTSGKWQDIYIRKTGIFHRLMKECIKRVESLL